MPLFIRDDEVSALADELTRVSKAPSKTEAVRQALRHELARLRASTPLEERLVRLQAKATAMGLPHRGFDMKAFSDELWDDR